MIVVSLINCPASLRGDLTKWLQEINTGVYVGNVTPRVRDELWKRICSEAKNGSATMVFSAQNEQRLDFRVHNSSWEPIDFDGIKLMLRPASPKLMTEGRGLPGARAAAGRYSHGGSRANHKDDGPRAYVAIDLETTGLDPLKDCILEMAAVKMINGREVGRFQSLVSPMGEISPAIEKLTGISNGEAVSEGKPLLTVLSCFLDFIGPLPVVSHNAEFDCSFIQTACEGCGIEGFENDAIDTLKLAKRKVPGLANYRLETLASVLELSIREAHRALPDCLSTRDLFMKLIERE